MSTLLFATLACTAEPTSSTAPPPDPASVERGWEVLRYGDFVGSGIPADLFFELQGEGVDVLEREGRSARLDRQWNLFEARNGVEVVGGITCFGCHAAEIDGVFYPGLGDPRAQLSVNQAGLLDLLETAITGRYGADSPEAEAAAPFLRGGRAVAAGGDAPFFGVNPAFSIERAAAAWRDPVTLEWLPEPAFEVPETPIWSDTPPWWHLRRRSTLYWTGLGRGEPERLLMQISVVGIEDVEHAEEILEDFADVRAWLEALEPPDYPGPLNATLAEEGRLAFDRTCSGCHGTYGPGGGYVERVIPLEDVGTDPVYALAFAGTPFADWLEESWFHRRSSGSGAAGGAPVVGYVAPPLDGIWATAPYLHNGSVPDLASLLDPSSRPERWRRDPLDTSLDHDRMGWPYTVPEAPDRWTYDVTVPGAGHGGHDYGEALSPSEQRAVLEYLKTL